LGSDFRQRLDLRLAIGMSILYLLTQIFEIIRAAGN
jgi:hypothetical protein